MLKLFIMYLLGDSERIKKTCKPIVILHSFKDYSLPAIKCHDQLSCWMTPFLKNFQRITIITSFFINIIHCFSKYCEHIEN